MTAGIRLLTSRPAPDPTTRTGRVFKALVDGYALNAQHYNRTWYSLRESFTRYHGLETYRESKGIWRARSYESAPISPRVETIKWADLYEVSDEAEKHQG
jgi:hypothetical protein